MAPLLIALFCADCWTTWHLLINYRKQVRESGLLGSIMFRGGYYGQLGFVAVRVLLLALFLTYGGIGACVGYGAATAVAVVNNLLVLRRLHAPR
jgi:hypothetical protein